MLILFLPKLLGVIVALKDREVRRGCGGALALIASFIGESLISALLSPVMMLIQSQFVVDVLVGRDSGWKAQNRNDIAMPFNASLKRHSGHTIAGLALAAISLLISWQTFLWLSTIATGLVLASVIAWATGLVSLGLLARTWNIFRIPEESAPVADPVLPDGRPVPRLEAAE
jgi:membrane glycosyltransferase